MTTGSAGGGMMGGGGGCWGEVDNFTFKLHVVLNELSFLLFTFV